jgi:hypothetical protein
MSKILIDYYIECEDVPDVELTLFGDGTISIRQEHSDEIVMPFKALADEMPRLQFLMDSYESRTKAK